MDIHTCPPRTEGPNPAARDASLVLSVADGDGLGLAAPFLQEPVAAVAVQHHRLTLLEAQTLLFQVLLVPGGPMGFPGLGFGCLLGGRHTFLLLLLKAYCLSRMGLANFLYRSTRIVLRWTYFWLRVMMFDFRCWWLSRMV